MNAQHFTHLPNGIAKCTLQEVSGDPTGERSPRGQLRRGLGDFIPYGCGEGRVGKRMHIDVASKVVCAL
jgi:hypothetical protein